MTQAASTVRSSDPLLGRVLEARYRIESLIARGGMATVYRGKDVRLNRTVAIKVMHPSFAADPGFVQRFEREAQAAARLTSPHVVAVHDQGTDAGVVFLVMEYVPGSTVRHLLRTHYELSPEQALAILEPVASALLAAHEAGFLHRDVKPENVLIGDDGRIRVTDFGLARAIEAADSNKTHGLLLGTVAYLSPEQVEHGDADERSDVYSAGILLYELLTGQVPFAGPTPMQVAYRHVHEDVPSPRLVRPGVPPAVAAIVERATRRAPAERFASVADMLREIRLVRGELPPADLSSAQPETLVIQRPCAAPAGPAQSPAPEAAVHVTTAEPVPAPSPLASLFAAGQAARPAQPEPAPDRPLSPRPAKRTRRSRRTRWIGLVALICLGVVVAFLFGPLQRVTVPTVLNKTATEARTIMAAANLKLNTAARDYSETVPKGQIIRTDPPGGRSVFTGATVTAVISRGPERYDVPNVAGGTVADAEAAFAKVKLRLGNVSREYHDTVAEDRIIATSPEIGQSVKPDTVVAVTVSRGPKPVELPKLVGSDGSKARETLTGLGLKVSSKQQISETVAKGLVISMTPSGGSTVPHGSTVKLVVSKGPPMVVVPDVVRKSAQEARRILEGAGFQVRVSYPLLVGVLDRVQSQNPKGGTSAPKGSTITIDVV